MDFTRLPFNLPGKIFRSAMPYSAYDPDGNLIQTYQDNNVSMVVMLSREDETLKVSGRNLLEEYKARGFDVIYLPIEDFGVPELPEIRKAIPHVLAHSQAGGNIAIHCHAGVGRTGMFIACLAKIGMGYSPEESINWVREYIPGAIEAHEQEQLVRKV
jgi:protein-tyrosine phosphatase